MEKVSHDQIDDQKTFKTAWLKFGEFLNENWSTWKGSADGDGLKGEEDVDRRSFALTEIKIADMIFETGLQDKELSITGEDKLRRLREKGDIRYGGNVFMGLLLDYQNQTNKENSALEAIRRIHGITWMEFMGQILRHPNGDRYVLYIYWIKNLWRPDYGEWRWDYSQLDNDRYFVHPSAGAREET